MNFLFMDGLIQNGNVGNTQVLPSFHTFCMGLGNTKDEIDKKDHEQFILLLKGRNNTYDASNLRRAIKQHKFDELHVKDNFSKLNESRRDHAAVVVEEEYHQNMFNSYCLYANGFRVFPVVTASELLWLNQKNKGLCNESLVVRDYDLQFVDERENTTSFQKGKDDWEEIDWIRGAKKSRDEKKYSLSVSEENGEEQSPYWKAFASDHVYFVSKGDDSIRMHLKNGKRRKHMRLCRKNKILKLNGMRKPLEGIFVSIQNIKEVKERFQETRYRYGETTYKIVIKRKDKGGHSCPLDIYGIARSMVHRAEVYSQKGRYRMAALVAGEALGILNGFHVSLMKTAYFIQAVAENAMAVRLLGGDENVLSQDVVFRMRMVKDDVARMVPVRKDQQNVLYNIFNDCRLFCREKEYFDAADHALSIMMQEKEGIGVNTHPRRGLMRCWLWLKEMVNNKNEQGE